MIELQGNDTFEPHPRGRPIEWAIEYYYVSYCKLIAITSHVDSK